MTSEKNKILRKRLYLLGVLAGVLFFLYAFYFFLENLHQGRLDSPLYNSDAFYIPAFFQDYFQGLYPVSGWILPFAPAFFPDMPMYLFSLGIAGNIQGALLLFAFLQLLLLIHALSMVVHRFFPAEDEKRALARGGLFMFTGISVLLAGTGADNNMFHPLFTSGHHASPFIFSIYCMVFLYDYTQTGRKRDALILLVLGTLNLASDKIFLIHFLGPACFTVLFLYFSGGERKKFPFGPLLILTAIFFLASLLVRLIKGAGLFRLAELPLKQTFLKNFSAQAITPGKIFAPLYEVFHFMPWAYLIIWLLAALALIVYLSRMYMRRDQTETFILTFFTALLLISFCALVPMGLFLKLSTIRYFFQIYVLLPFIAVFIIVKIIPIKTHLFVLQGLVFVCLSLSMYAVSKVESSPANVINHKLPLAKCLDENREDAGLREGLAQYWNAKPLKYFSEKGLEINQIHEGLAPYYWLNNYRWFLKTRQGTRPAYNFIVMDQLPRQKVLEKFGAPSRILKCESSEVFVYHPPRDKFIRQISVEYYEHIKKVFQVKE